eukprot:Gb_28140 [translate_table: standard]
MILEKLGQVGQTGLSRVNFGSLDFDARPLQVGGSCSLSSVNTHVHIVREPSPLPVLAYVENLPAGLDAVSHVSHFNVADSRLGPAKSSQYVMSRSMSPQFQKVGDLLCDSFSMSSNMMEDFLKLAKSNTEKNLETCGVLAGSLKKGTFYVTTLIIPKQESTSDSCQTMNEEEIYAVQEECSLLPLGWIHLSICLLLSHNVYLCLSLSYRDHFLNFTPGCIPFGELPEGYKSVSKMAAYIDIFDYCSSSTSKYYVPEVAKGTLSALLSANCFYSGLQEGSFVMLPIPKCKGISSREGTIVQVLENFCSESALSPVLVVETSYIFSTLPFSNRFPHF